MQQQDQQQEMEEEEEEAESKAVHEDPCRAMAHTCTTQVRQPGHTTGTDFHRRRAGN